MILYCGTENQLQVLIDFPRPDSVMKENFYEDTMLLLEMIKDKRHKENREKKVSTIYQFFNQYFFPGGKDQGLGSGTKAKKRDL